MQRENASQSCQCTFQSSQKLRVSLWISLELDSIELIELIEYTILSMLDFLSVLCELFPKILDAT